MPFQKGKVANPHGAPSRVAYALKWDLIDRYVSKATQHAYAVIEGTDPDIQLVDDPEKRAELKLKAVGHILKLAPERVVGAEGGDLTIKWLAG